jgi:hypothetical protein
MVSGIDICFTTASLVRCIWGRQISSGVDFAGVGASCLKVRQAHCVRIDVVELTFFEKVLAGMMEATGD